MSYGDKFDAFPKNKSGCKSLKFVLKIELKSFKSSFSSLLLLIYSLLLLLFSL